jgi:hypothetical protein
MKLIKDCITWGVIRRWGAVSICGGHRRILYGKGGLERRQSTTAATKDGGGGWDEGSTEVDTVDQPYRRIDGRGGVDTPRLTKYYVIYSIGCSRLWSVPW